MKAPSITSKGNGRWVYPAPGTRIHAAWQDVWRSLARSRKDPFRDGLALAEAVAPDHDLSPLTVYRMLRSATRAGLLDTQYRTVAGRRGPRTRTFYRIAERGDG